MAVIPAPPQFSGKDLPDLVRQSWRTISRSTMPIAARSAGKQRIDSHFCYENLGYSFPLDPTGDTKTFAESTGWVGGVLRTFASVNPSKGVPESLT